MNLPYEKQVGLYLNIDRQIRKQSLAFAYGYKLAKSSGLLSREWYDAMAKFEEEVDNLMFEGNSMRARIIAQNETRPA